MQFDVQHQYDKFLKMQSQSYPTQYQELQLLSSSQADNFKLYLVRDQSTLQYRMAKKTSIYSCTDASQNELLTEVKILKQLNHPHVLKYYDVFLEGDDFIVVLEFCEEGDLGHYAAKKKEKKESFSEKLLLSWVLQMLMGLEHIHSKNIIHRLIRSQNIYLNHQGDLKLGSFGNAKILENTLEKAMTVVGSECSLSPQMVQGKSYDSKIDIWGLGCLIYELATHQRPFHMTSLPELYQLIVKTPAQDLPTKYSKYLNPIYKKMMKKNPNFRPSASELLQQEVFVKLMKEYTKKKKIDSLDLREVVPKQLLTHKNKTSRLLPPLLVKNTSSPTDSKIKVTPKSKKKDSQHIATSRSKQKQISSTTSASQKLPTLTSKTVQSEQEASSMSQTMKQDQITTVLPKVEKKQSPKIPKPKANNPPALTETSSAVKQKQTKQNEAQKTKQKQQSEQVNSNRLTLPDLMQGEYISLLCQIKLELLQKKYSPNMSQIFEQTIEFEQ